MSTNAFVSADSSQVVEGAAGKLSNAGVSITRQDLDIAVHQVETSWQEGEREDEAVGVKAPLEIQQLRRELSGEAIAVACLTRHGPLRAAKRSLIRRFFDDLLNGAIPYRD